MTIIITLEMNNKYLLINSLVNFESFEYSLNFSFNFNSFFSLIFSLIKGSKLSSVSYKK